VTLSDVRSVSATFSLVFTDATAGDTLPANTPIKAAHFTELLDAINAVQPGMNLSWPSPAPAVGGTVLTIHVQGSTAAAEPGTRERGRRDQRAAHQRDPPEDPLARVAPPPFL